MSGIEGQQPVNNWKNGKPTPSRSISMMQGASRSAAVRKLQRDRKRREEDERFAAMCGPVTVTRFKPKDDADG